jgi:hypothetical protein
MKKIFVFIYSTLQSGLFCKYKANVCLAKEQIVPFALLYRLLRTPDPGSTLHRGGKLCLDLLCGALILGKKKYF